MYDKEWDHLGIRKEDKELVQKYVKEEKGLKIADWFHEVIINWVNCFFPNYQEEQKKLLPNLREVLLEEISKEWQLLKGSSRFNKLEHPDFLYEFLRMMGFIERSVLERKIIISRVATIEEWCECVETIFNKIKQSFQWEEFHLEKANNGEEKLEETEEFERWLKTRELQMKYHDSLWEVVNEEIITIGRKQQQNENMF